jgi:hypothetical protein
MQCTQTIAVDYVYVDILSWIVGQRLKSLTLTKLYAE